MKKSLIDKMRPLQHQFNIDLEEMNQKYIPYKYSAKKLSKEYNVSKSCITHIFKQCIMETNIYKIGKELFITSDEEIKEWFIVNGTNGYSQPMQYSKMFPKDKFPSGHNKSILNLLSIILTTDQDLIKDGVQAIDDEFLEWFVKNPSCEFVEIEEEYNEERIVNGKDIGDYSYKIIIPKEESIDFGDIVNEKFWELINTQETLEEVALKLFPDKSYWIGSGNSSRLYDPNYRDREAWINGAKWQQEKSYSKEDMKNAFDSAREFNSLDGVVLPMGGDMSDLQPLHLTFEEWFEQFKKK